MVDRVNKILMELSHKYNIFLYEVLNPEPFHKELQKV
jgi:hypothetical protein